MCLLHRFHKSFHREEKSQEEKSQEEKSQEEIEELKYYSICILYVGPGLPPVYCTNQN